MRFGLKEEIIAKINSVFEKYPKVEQVIIYGSRAKDTFCTGSDIDITLKGKQLNDTILSKVYWDIDDLNTPYLVDISNFDKIDSTALEEHIKRVGRVFYSKQLLQKN